MFFATLVGLLAPAAATAAWTQPVGGEAPINREAARDASEPSIEEFSGTPYIAWAETDSGGVGQIQAARLDPAGTAWERPEDSASPINLSSSESAEDPTLRRDDPGGDPCVAFDEASGAGTQIHMSCLTTATDWTMVVDSPDKDPAAVASEPSLTLFGGETWVAWSEVDTHGVNQIRAAKLPAPGTTWQRVPDTVSPINAVDTDNAFGPSLVAVGDRLYVTWSEIDSGNVNQVRVARLNTAGDAWEQVGGALNEDPSKNAVEPSVADVGGVPYVAWSETDGLPADQIRVARLDSTGTTWEIVAAGSQINEAFNQNAEHPSLAAIGGVPYVAWSEPNSSAKNQVRVARLDSTGTAWEQVVGGGSPINQNDELPAIEPSLVATGGIPYVAWSEENESGAEQVRATRLAPEFLGSQAEDLSPTGATLDAEVRTYGLPFPVGFGYGVTPGEHETTPQPAPGGQGDVVTVSEPVAGLSPKTAYEAGPFATAGVPLPRLPGATFTFDTPAVQHTLTVAKAGSGAGQVTSTPAGIECGSSCVHSFEDGTAVTLEAVASAGSTFSGWSGGGCPGTGSCVVTMDADPTVTATFTQDPSPPGPPGPSGPPGGGPTSPTPPNPEPPAQNRLSMKILKARIAGRQGRATFSFAAVGGTAEAFQCALARRRSRPKFSRCRAPKTYRHLKPGKYFFEVRALGAAGPESSPAVRPFRLRP
jgi:hypothetical protein